MRVIGYIRVSTEEQAAGGTSMGAQAAKLKGYAQLYEHDLVDLVEDPGASAKTLDRPGLRRALAMLERGEADGLLVAKLDRLTRSVRDMAHLLEPELFGGRFELLSVEEQLDTRTPVGRLVINILAAVSQWEREEIGKRTRTGLQFLRSQGVRLGAPATDDPAVIARVLELRRDGLSYREICGVLTAEGWPTLRGGAWSTSVVKRIMSGTEEPQILSYNLYNRDVCAKSAGRGV